MTDFDDSQTKKIVHSGKEGKCGAKFSIDIRVAMGVETLAPRALECGSPESRAWNEGG